MKGRFQCGVSFSLGVPVVYGAREGEAPAEPRYGDLLATGKPWASAQRLIRIRSRTRQSLAGWPFC